MKKFLAVLVVLGLCGLYWYGCHKKKAPMTEETTESAVTEQAPATTPPPPPPPATEGEGEKEAE